MALDIAKKDKKQHRHRKNPRSHDLYKEENRAQNEERPKQRWVINPNMPAGGFWVREAT